MNLPKSYNLKPNLVSALVLKCPYCRSNSLNKSYFVFKKTCDNCLYPIEREEGYWSGASWLVNFPITSTLSFILVVALMAKTDLNEEIIAGLVAAFVFIFGALIFPFCQAFYMWLDHKMKPLNQDDYEEFQRIKAKQ